MEQVLIPDGQTGRVRQVQQVLDQYLRANTTFLAMPPAQQLSFYKEALHNGLEALNRATEQATSTDPTRLSDVGGLAGDFLDEVDFPQFVQDLVTGVYGSIVKSTIEQMNAYVEMYKGLAQPLAALARQISDADALGQVASSDPLRFTMNSDGGVVDNDSGIELDRTNEEVQRMMFQAKLELARERRLLMRETMLMGVQRLVVDKGIIRAGLVFNIKAVEKFQSRNKRTEIEESGGQLGGSFFGLFGGGKTDRDTKITVSTRALDTDTQLAAQITGHVELQFTTDRFDLNNFANLFGDAATRNELQQRQAAGGAPGAPGAPAGQPASAAPAPVAVAPRA